MKLNLNRNLPKRHCRGWSLTEVMVATGIGSLLFAAIASLSMFSARSFVAMGNYADLDRASRQALDFMSREIRQTKSLTSFSATQLEFVDGDDQRLVYRYDPGARTLIRTRGSTNTVQLLQQCDYLDFNISQRNPTNNFQFIAASDAKTAKLIDVTWRCSRTIMGARVNTESVQTAKIVIRN